MVRTPSLPASVFSDFVQFEGNDVENFLQQTPFRDFMDKSISVILLSSSNPALLIDRLLAE